MAKVINLENFIQYQADRETLTYDEKILLASGSNILERRHLARRTDLPIEVLRILAEDPDEEVRKELAASCIDKGVHSKLRSDPSPSVRLVAATCNLYW